MSTNTFASNFSADASTYIAAKLLLLAQKVLVFYDLAETDNMPKANGRTYQYSRYNRLNLPQTTLSEGVTPSDSSMSVSTVTCVMDQWGAVIPLSDVSIDSVKHPVLQQAIMLGAMQAAETIDREIVKVLLTGTNIFFPGAVTARGSLASTDKVTTATVGKVTSQMRSDGAIPFDGRSYVGVCDSFVEDDITSDSTFVTAAAYGPQVKLYNNEIGTWKGVRWKMSNTIPRIQLLAGGSAATSGTAGSLSNSTTYNASFSVVDLATGHETFIGASISVTTGVGDTSFDATAPALPAGATANSTLNLYVGANGGTRYLKATGIAASAVTNVKTIPTSGQVAQVAPVTGFHTHFSFVFGKQGLVCPQLNKVKAYLTPPTPTDSDPLVQRRKAGWKCDFKPAISNDLFIGRIESAATNG